MGKKIKFQNLRMIALEKEGNYSLDISIESGFAGFLVTVPLNKLDFEVIASDAYRATLLHAAMHHPFQLRDTALSENEQRNYLDIILHASEPEVERLLTELDHGDANGAISNMVSITANGDYQGLRNGNWFN